jgi:inorganic pyrophosphatase
LRAVIETPQGSRLKLKYDAGLGTFRLTHSLPTGMTYPYDFGFIPGTRGQDGDPLDVLVLMDGPAFPGTVVEIRLLGVLEAEQREAGQVVRNDRLLAVAEGSIEHATLRGLSDLDPAFLSQIEAFFVMSSRGIGKEFRLVERRGRRQAAAIVEQSLVG